MLLISLTKSEYAMTIRVVTANMPKELAEEQQRETLAALEEVKSGRVVENAEVQAWAAGLGRAKQCRARGKGAS
jgi:predicted transcriptional regulator